MLTISYITVSVINTMGMSNLKTVTSNTKIIHMILQLYIILKPFRYIVNIRFGFTILQAKSKASAFSEIIICTQNTIMCVLCNVFLPPQMSITSEHNNFTFIVLYRHVLM